MMCRLAEDAGGSINRVSSREARAPVGLGGEADRAAYGDKQEQKGGSPKDDDPATLAPPPSECPRRNSLTVEAIRNQECALLPLLFCDMF